LAQQIDEAVPLGGVYPYDNTQKVQFGIRQVTLCAGASTMSLRRP
jgi:hypothetical protein